MRPDLDGPSVSRIPFWLAPTGTVQAAFLTVAPPTQLYQIAHSPFCIPIRQALSALGVEFSTVDVSNGNRAALIELTQGKSYEVPVLVHQGRVICETDADSLEVPGFVDQTWGQGRLFPKPKAGLQALIIRHLENDVEGLTFRLTDIHTIPKIPDLVERVMIIRHKERRFGRGCLEQWRLQRDSIYSDAIAQLRPYDQLLEEHSFLLGEAPVYSDFLLHGILGNLTWNQGNAFPPLGRLADWYSRLNSFRYG